MGGKQPAQSATTTHETAKKYHVVELFDSDSTTLEQVLSVFDKLGAPREKVMSLIEDVDKKGKAIVIAGSLETCEQAAELFHEIGMKTNVRLLAEEDLQRPSEYEDSDVTVVGAKGLAELIDNGESFLIKFFSPNCAHCTAMVPAYKAAATQLKKVQCQFSCDRAEAAF